MRQEQRLRVHLAIFAEDGENAVEELIGALVHAGTAEELMKETLGIDWIAGWVRLWQGLVEAFFRECLRCGLHCHRARYTQRWRMMSIMDTSSRKASVLLRQNDTCADESYRYNVW